MRPSRFPTRFRWLAVLAVLSAATLAGPARADDPKPDPRPTPAPESSTPAPEADDPKPDSERPRRVAPTVRSANEAADSLRRFGSGDPYDGSIDWRTIPAWQQTSFYGIRAKGTFFVFVVDCSGSMEVDLRLDRAKQELRRCISNLRQPQRFLIIFFNHRSIPMGGGIPRSADSKEKRATLSWLNSIAAEGGTDPRSAMNLALGLRPDAIFLLTDGEFPSGTATTILSRNRDQVPIHCINLGSELGVQQLQTIAEGSGGRYVTRR